jgi:PTS system nitrogen regulatory IIA component
MKILDILSPTHVFSNVECNSKKAAMELLAKNIASSNNGIDQIDVIGCLIARERLGSTGLGNGIAIPHGRLKYCEKTIATFIQLKNGIDYEAVDNMPVDLIFALIVPEESTNEHLQILAILAKMLSKTETVDKLRNSETSKEIFSILTN